MRTSITLLLRDQPMLRNFIITCGLMALFTAPAAAEDRVLTDAVAFTGAVLFLGHDVPGLVIGAVRNGETTVAGFGKTRPGGGLVISHKSVGVASL